MKFLLPLIASATLVLGADKDIDFLQKNSGGGFDKVTINGLTNVGDFLRFHPSTGVIIPVDTTGTGNAVLSASPTLTGTFLFSAGSGTSVTLNSVASVTGAFSGAVTVLDDAYAGGWDSSTQVPTKNALYDKIQTLVVLNGAYGTPSSLTLTNANGLPLTTGVTGVLPIANGGTNASTAAGALDSLITAEDSVASATTTDLGAVTSRNVNITGTTTITSFGTATAGIMRWGRFAAALTLTHNATSLLLPNNGSNITTAANDRFSALSLGSGNWLVYQYTKADGSALQGGGGGGAPTTATYITQTADGTLSNEQALAALSTGIMRVATTTGVVTSLTDSAGIFANISDESGSGSLLGGTSPTIVTPSITTSATFSSVSAPAYAAGKFFYDSTDDTPCFYNSSSNLKLNLGEEFWVRYVNNTGSTITNGQTLYINGASSGVPTCALADADTDAMSRFVMVATETVTNGSTGRATVAGIVHNFDTSAFSAGAEVYLSTTAGGLTATGPASPAYQLSMGRVLTSNATTGSLLVTVGPRTRGYGTYTSFLTSDASSTTTTYADVSSALNVAVGSGETWICEWTGFVNFSGAGEGGMYAVNGPTASVIDYSVEVRTGTSAFAGGPQTAYDTGATATAVQAGSFFRVTAFITTTASGTIALRGRAETGAGNTFITKRSASLRATRQS